MRNLITGTTIDVMSGSIRWVMWSSSNRNLTTKQTYWKEKEQEFKFGIQVKYHFRRISGWED